jgi:NADP-dependent 3-hydroxy acid dehydrogenase YdfG
MSGLLAGKSAVITGATSGIGEALAERAVAEGASVVGIGRNDEKLAAAAERWGDAFFPLRVDLARREERQAAIARIRERMERVDILVNNAAEVVYATPIGLDTAGWASLMETNVLAAIDLVQGLSPAFGPDAHVINVSSINARQIPSAKFAPYALTKAALERFTEGLRLELTPRGVKVSSIAPGLVSTPVYDKVAGFEGARAALKAQVPDWLPPAEVADAMVWMLTRPPGVVVSELSILPRGQAR